MQVESDRELPIEGAPGLGDPRLGAAFPHLTEEQIRSLEPLGRRISVAKGEPVWKPGQTDLCMYIVEAGEMDIVDGQSGKLVATHDKGSFSGDVDILSGRATIVGATAATDLELIEVPAESVRQIVSSYPSIAEIILHAFLVRRALLVESDEAGPLVIGSRFSPDTLRIREFLARNHIPIHWEDLESRVDTGRLLEQFHVTVDQTPIVVLPNGEVLLVPSNSDLGERLGIKRPIRSKVVDLVIVGAGPAGLAAAVYGASEGLETLLVDSIGPGGQAGASSKIENYMGFPLGTTGQELADSAVIQAEKFGARLLVPAKVMGIHCNPLGGHRVDLEEMNSIDCRCVILTPGAAYRKLEVPDLDKYEGRGIYYAATNVERVVCGDSCVAVVGGGNSAGQAAVFLAEKAGHVFLVVRGKELKLTMSNYLARRIEQSGNISLLLESEITAIHGEHCVESVTITDNDSGSTREEEVAGIFVMIGAIPHTSWLPDSIVRDKKGFVLTGPQLVEEGHWKQRRPPFFLETSCPGVFAAGDVRANSIKRVASAVGEGSMSVAFVHQFIAS